MKLYLISRTDKDAVRWDNYDSLVVAAENEESALDFHPRGQYYLTERDIRDRRFYGWTSKEHLKIECIGESNGLVEKVIISSFNAG